MNNEVDLDGSIYSILLESNGLLSSDNESLSSDPEGEPEQYEDNYEVHLVDIASSCHESVVILTGLDSQAAELLAEQQYLNNEVAKLNSSVSFIFAVLLIFAIFGMIKCCFTIFNKYLGLGQA